MTSPGLTSEDGAFGGSLGWGRRPALLLIDMMRAYFTPGSPFDLGSGAAVVGCGQLLAAARAAGLPVLHTRVRYRPGASDGGLFVRKVGALRLLAEDVPGDLGEFAAGLEPRPDEVVIVKQYASAFFGTSLAATLTAAGIDTAVIAGVSTSGCVRASATDAMQHGFRPIVVAEACGDRTPAIHTANVADLQAKYADIATIAEATAHFTDEAAGLQRRGLSAGTRPASGSWPPELPGQRYPVGGYGPPPGHGNLLARRSCSSPEPRCYRKCTSEDNRPPGRWAGPSRSYSRSPGGRRVRCAS